jgi:hypothetical protein
VDWASVLSPEWAGYRWQAAIAPGLVSGVHRRSAGVDRLNRSLSSGSAISPKMRAVETPLVVRSDNEGWSLYGAQRLQPVATGGKCECAGNGSDNRKPLPWAATDCLRRSMVRRGSTVRVRQRALQSTCKRDPFSSLTRRPVSGRGRSWKALWKTQLRSRSRRRVRAGACPS